MNRTRSAADLFQAHRDELGFVSRAQCKEKDLYTVERDGSVVGAAIVNHCVQKPQTTLYDIAVKHKREGIGSELVTQIARASPHEKIIAKCPATLPANAFYQATGWKRIGEDPGKNRTLNIWQYDIPDVDIITTGRPDLTEYAAEYGWLTGTRLDEIGRYENAGITPEFIDVHWEEPDRDKLLAKTMTHAPKYVVAGDYDGDNYDTINDFARELNQFAENVIVVPHEPGEVKRVPEWAVVGYSTPTGYAGTDAPIWEYMGRDVHVLGGTMNQIKIVVDHLKNDIVSMDTNTHHRDATRFGEYWTTNHGRVIIPSSGDDIREAYENAVLNMTYALDSWGML